MRTLREQRAAKLWSVRDLAKASGVTATTIIQIEHGRQVPRFATMRRLAEALEVNPEEVSEFSQAIRVRGRGTT